MKKIIQLFAVVLMLATVIVLATIPAGATVNYTDSVNDYGTGNGLDWDAYLYVDGSVGTARLYQVKKSSGLIPPILFGAFRGSISNNYNSRALYKSGDSSDKTLNIIGSSDLAESIPPGDIIRADCYYWINGTQTNDESTSVCHLKLPKSN